MKKISFFIVLIIASFALHAQEPPFYHAIQSFKSQDSIKSPPKKAILFIGSSSFTNWKDVQEYFPQHPIINRGFGGSSLPDLIRYVNDIVFPYTPKQVVVYCGENDLAGSDSISSETVTERFITLFGLIRAKYPKISIVFISMKPSPSREKIRFKIDAGNYLIEEFLKKQKNTAFIDVYHLMLDKNGLPRKELFIDDMLHMNKTGYEIWQKAIAPYLK